MDGDQFERQIAEVSQITPNDQFRTGRGFDIGKGMNDKMFKTADEPLTAPPKERRDFELPSMMNFAKAKQRDALDTSGSIKDDSVIMRE